MYEYCEKHSINFRRTGKLLVALEEQRPYIEGLHKKATELPWPKHTSPVPTDRKVLPTEIISGDRARELEPNLSHKIAAALLAHPAGIVDAKGLMESLSKEISEAQHGAVWYSAKVVRLDRFTTSEHLSPSQQQYEHGWVVQVVDEAGKPSSILARTLINAAGLSSTLILNSTLPEVKRLAMYYAKGSYVSYSGEGLSEISHLIYPCPDLEKDSSFQSLGTVK